MTKQSEAVGQYFTFGPFAYDIDKAMKIIAADPDRPTHPVKVAEFARALSLEKSAAEYLEDGVIPLMRGDVDEEYARTQADLSAPVIVADLSLRDEGDPAYMLIDGTHRLRRAVVEKCESLQAYVLTFTETQQIRSTMRYGPGRTRR